ncbi:hypothetical protein [Photobacterium kishitanii]|uniref:hypothetical protein n=1 Tax=Photobacterium kishitanii TaxID=318456 RepID=UPI00043492D8|nr:hypothetical protein [Photobacterium kishitanii]CEO38572.1 hypothetical protein PPBDW_I20588 [Photobacterium kishitanii]
MTFIEFLETLANDALDHRFIERLITTPTAQDNHYFHQGDRWCCVEDLLVDLSDAKKLLRKYAIHGIDPSISFSSGNLKAQYIPDEDFINDGCAVVVFAIVGSQWIHCVRLSGQNELLERLSSENF